MERASDEQVFMWNTFDFNNYVMGAPMVDENGWTQFSYDDLQRIGIEIETQKEIIGDSQSISDEIDNPQQS